MARILIGEPVDEIRLLLDLHVRRLGHEPVLVDGANGVDSHGVDAAVLEPAAESQLTLARELRSLRPGFPLVFVSTEAASPMTRELTPVRHILKPFDRVELIEAVEAALRAGAETHASHT